MNTERTNLLPPQRLKRSHRVYFLRLAVVAGYLFIILIIIHSILLLPSYLTVSNKVHVETERLAELNASSKANGEQNVQTKLANLQTEAKYLSTLNKTPSVSTLIRAILAVPRPGIGLIGFTYTAPSKGAMATMEVSGTASTRETLRSYNLALSALPYVSSANLPISDYAEESNIPFTITLTGSLIP